MDYEAIAIARLLTLGGLFCASVLLAAFAHRLGLTTGVAAWCARHPLAVNWLKAGLVVTFIGLVGLFSFLRHYGLETSILDLGNVEQTFWNTIHGQPFRMTTDSSAIPLPDTRLAFHIEPIILPLSLFYWFLPRTETLLLIQTIAVGLSGLLVASIAERQLRSQFAGLAFLTAYLTAQPIVNGLTFDVHPVAFGLPAWLLAYWFFVRGQYTRSLLAGVALMFCREDAAILALFFALFLLGHRRSRLAGVLLSFITLSWLTVLAALFTHYHPNGYEYLWRLQGASGALIGERIGAFLLDPIRLQYLAWLLAPLAFFSFAAPRLALLASVSVGIVLVGGSRRELLGELHYHLLSFGVLIVAAIAGARAIGRGFAKRSRRTALPMAVLTMSLLVFFSPGQRRVLPAPDWTRLAAIQAAATTIPADATVAASANAGPWVVRRSNLYLLTSLRRATAEYTLALTCNRDVCDNLSKKAYDGLLDEVAADPANRLVFERAGVLLFQRQTTLSTRTAP